MKLLVYSRNGGRQELTTEVEGMEPLTTRHGLMEAMAREL